AGGEQHREPGEDPELRLLVVLAELDVTEPAQPHPQGEGDKEGDDDHVVPTEATDDVLLERSESLLRGLREADGEDAGDTQHDERRPEDSRVGAAPPLVHDQVLAGPILWGRGRWPAVGIGRGGAHRSGSFWVSDNFQDHASACQVPSQPQIWWRV